MVSDQIFIWCMLGSGVITYLIFIWCMQDPADCWPNIIVYAGSGRCLTNIQCVCKGPVDYWPIIHLVNAGSGELLTEFHSVYAGSGGWPTKYSVGVWKGPDGLLTKYSFGECRDLADLPTKYSFGEYRGQVDFRLNIHSAVYRVQADDQLNIQLVCRDLADFDWIFIQCMKGQRGLPTEYSVGVCRDLADYWSVYSFWCMHSRIHWISLICTRWIGIE